MILDLLQLPTLGDAYDPGAGRLALFAQDDKLYAWIGGAGAAEQVYPAVGGGGGGENPVTYDAGTSGSAITIDCANGPKQTVVLDAATPAINITNLGMVSRLHLVLLQDATGGRVPTFTVSGRTLVYQGGAVPPFSTGANARDKRVFTDDAVSNVVDVEAGIGYAAP